jgi:hypothetical protein
MAGSTTNLDLIVTAQAQKEITANALFDAMSPATLFGRRAAGCAALTWAYYGGPMVVAGTSDGLVQIFNGAVSLTADTTNFVEADADGVVSVNTVGFTPGAVALYEILTGPAAVISYTDWRVSISGAAGGVESVNGQIGFVELAAEDIPIADAGGYFAGAEVEAALQEIGLALASLGGGGDVTAGSSDLTEYAVIVGGGGTDVRPLGSLGTAGQVLTSAGAAADPTWTSQPHDVHAFHPGVPGASALVFRGPIARAFTFPADFAGSYFSASANATASTVFDVQKNGVSIGTVTIAAGGTVATFATSGGTAQSFAAGDLLTIIAPATPDSTLADVGFALAGAR